jgi:hypothetical protein
MNWKITGLVGLIGAVAFIGGSTHQPAGTRLVRVSQQAALFPLTIMRPAMMVTDGRGKLLTDFFAGVPQMTIDGNVSPSSHGCSAAKPSLVRSILNELGLDTTVHAQQCGGSYYRCAR